MTLRINKNILLQLSIVLFYSIILLKDYFGIEKGIFVKILIACYVFLGIYMTVVLLTKANSLMLLIMSLIIMFAMITAVFGNNYRINDIFLVLTYFGIAFIPVYIKFNYKLFTWFAYSIILFLIVSFFTVSSVDKVFAGVSENYISSLLLIVLGYHFISCFQNEKNPNFLLIILSFALTIWGIGRAGIISMGFIFLASPFLLSIKKRYKFLMLFSFMALSIIAFHYNPEMSNVIFKRFHQSGLDSPRKEINKEYLQKSLSSPNYFLFGTTLTEVSAIVNLPGNTRLNTHNSFIRAHVYYGFAGFLLLMIILTYTAFNFVKTKEYILVVLFIALLIRSFFDEQAFHGPYDPLIYSLIFITIKNKTLFIDKE
jgi:hypothetical protein